MEVNMFGNTYEQYEPPRELTIDLDSGLAIKIIRSGECIPFDEWIGELVERKLKEIINDRTLVMKLLEVDT